MKFNQKKIIEYCPIQCLFKTETVKAQNKQNWKMYLYSNYMC